MAGPPADIDPGDVWATQTAMPFPHKVVDFPRKGPDGLPIGQVAIKPLSQDESKACSASAELFVRRMLKQNGGAVPNANERSDGYTNLFENRSAEEILFRAFRRADDPKRSFFPTIEAIGRGLTTDEVGVCMRLYNTVRDEIGCITARMSQEELDAWIEVLGKGGQAYPLASLSSAAWIELTLYMASLLSNARTGNSSPGTSPDDTISPP